MIASYVNCWPSGVTGQWRGWREGGGERGEGGGGIRYLCGAAVVSGSDAGGCPLHICVLVFVCM
jgi:hypothetical protein